MNCLIANTETLLDRVFALRYQCYRRDESIPESPDARFSDKFDNLPNSISILAESGGDDAAATVRISVVRPRSGWQDSPAQHVFADVPELRQIAAEGYVEASRLCFGSQARRSAFFTLTGHMAALADVYQSGWLVACPRTEHTETYQRLFGFRPLAPARQYFGVKFQTQLLGIRRTELAEFVRGTRPMRQAWTDALSNLTASPALLRGQVLQQFAQPIQPALQRRTAVGDPLCDSGNPHLADAAGPHPPHFFSAHQPGLFQ